MGEESDCPNEIIPSSKTDSDDGAISTFINKSPIKNQQNSDDRNKTTSRGLGESPPPQKTATSSSSSSPDLTMMELNLTNNPDRGMRVGVVGDARDSRPCSSQPTSKSVGKTIIHQNAPKNAWDISLKREVSVLILGDSNLRLARDLPTDWEVHVFPGCDLNNAAMILSKLQITKDLKHIITCVGINNKSEPLSNVKLEINKLFNGSNKFKGIQGHFLGVGIPDSIQGVERQNLEGLNKLGSSKFSLNYIDPLPCRDINIIPNDKYKIHYDQFTVDSTIGLIRNHFLMGGGPYSQRPPQRKNF